MNKFLAKSFVLMVLGVLLSACAVLQTTPISSTEKKQSTPIVVIPSSTISPTITVHLTPALIQQPTISSQATLEVPNAICIPTQGISGWEKSPNGNWVFAGFYLKNKEDLLLQVVSIDCSKSWKIYLSTYKSKDSFDHHDGIIPSQWSKDGKFLYAFVGSRIEGCCWKGLRYVLLIRLDLETGEQIAILNTDSNSSYAFDFIISDSNNYVLFTPTSKQAYDFALLDLKTWKTKEFSLKFSTNIDLIYAVMSPNENKVILPLFKNIEFNDYFVDSIALIDLETGKQKLLVSGLTKERELYPVRWLDENHVLLSNIDPKFDKNNLSAAKYWLLDILSDQLNKTQP